MVVAFKGVVRSIPQDPPVLFKDQWGVLPSATIAIPAAAADIDFSNVEIASGFLPSGVTIQAVVLLIKWRKQVDSSGAANAINGANKRIRVKKNSGAWGTDDTIAMTFENNSLATAASATEGGDVRVGILNISDVVDDLSALALYNVRSDETNRSDALIVDGASLTLHDVDVGFRVYFTTP